MSNRIYIALPFWRRGSDNPFTGTSGTIAATIILAIVFAVVAAFVWCCGVLVWFWLGWYTKGSDATGFIWPSVFVAAVLSGGLQWLLRSSGMWGFYDTAVHGDVRITSWDITSSMFGSRSG